MKLDANLQFVGEYIVISSAIEQLKVEHCRFCWTSRVYYRVNQFEGWGCEELGCPGAIFDQNVYTTRTTTTAFPSFSVDGIATLSSEAIRIKDDAVFFAKRRLLSISISTETEGCNCGHHSFGDYWDPAWDHDGPDTYDDLEPVRPPEDTVFDAKLKPKYQQNRIARSWARRTLKK